MFLLIWEFFESYKWKLKRGRERLINKIILFSYMDERIETTIMSSRGQIVIPGKIRKMMNIDEGSIFAIVGNENNLILRKIDIPNRKRIVEEAKTTETIGRKDRLSIKEIKKKLKENKEEIRKYSVKKLGVFGSFLKGKQKKESDIDILVDFKVTNYDNYMDLKEYLEDLFNRKVDLVVERTLKPELNYVKKEAKYVRF